MTVDQAIEQLKSSAKDTRSSAARALGNLDHGYAQSVTALLCSLEDKESEVRVSAVDALMKIWRALHQPQRDSLILSAAEVDPDDLFAPVIPVFKELLKDENKYVRLEAAEGLRQLYLGNDAVLNVFLESARDTDELLRRRAAYAFWQGAAEVSLVLSAGAPFLGGGRSPLHDVGTAPVIAVLIEMLKDSSRSVREYAVSALGSIGPKANAAAPALVETLQDADEIVRFKAANALARVGDANQAGLALLLAGLRDDDRMKRKAAAHSLRAMGTEARPAIPQLVAALQDQELHVRARCAQALGNIGLEVGDEAIHALIALEKDSEYVVRHAAEAALAAIGADNVETARLRAARLAARDFYPPFGFQPEDIPGFICMLRDPSPDTRAYAATALRLVGGDLRAAIPNLISLLNDEDRDLRRRVAETLRAIGDAALPALQEAALAGDQTVSSAALRLLTNFPH